MPYPVTLSGILIAIASGKFRPINERDLKKKYSCLIPAEGASFIWNPPRKEFVVIHNIHPRGGASYFIILGEKVWQFNTEMGTAYESTLNDYLEGMPAEYVQ